MAKKDATPEDNKIPELTTQQALTFPELAKQVADIADTMNRLNSYVKKGEQGNNKTITKFYNFTKGRITVGFGTEIVVIDALHPNFLMWAGDPDPALAHFRLDRTGTIV